MAAEKKLLVEGPADLRVITELAKKNGIDLGMTPSGAYPILAELKSMPVILDSEFLATVASGSDLKILGIVVDADEDPMRRLAELRQACLLGFQRVLPGSLPDEGLILEADSGKPRLGIWMMPNNSSRGMLETFLAFLVPETGNLCWEWTDELCDHAREKGANFKDVHRDKARIHAYLAFQDEPGRQLHEAVINRILDPDHEMAKKFLGWFCRLYELPLSFGETATVGS